MKKKLTLALVCAAVISANLFAAHPAKHGAKAGEWSQDYDAVCTLAKSNSLPILVNFTGSDWCFWCKLMDRKVFGTKAWKKWADGKIALAFIDFPSDKSLVPKEYVNRNKALAEKYSVRGYPTYILFASDGERILGRLGASRDATPESFIAQIEALLPKEE